MTQRPERRRAPRAPERIELAISEEGQELRTETKNISAAGAYCTLERFIPPMSKLELRFDLPTVGSARRSKVRCNGVVVRVEPVVTDGEAMRYNTALFFTDIDERDRQTISQFVRERLAAARPTSG